MRVSPPATQPTFRAMANDAGSRRSLTSALVTIKRLVSGIGLLRHLLQPGDLGDDPGLDRLVLDLAGLPEAEGDVGPARQRLDLALDGGLRRDRRRAQPVPARGALGDGATLQRPLVVHQL